MVPSKVAATSAVERGGMANGVVGLVGLNVGVGLGEKAKRFGWLWKRTGEDRKAEKAILDGLSGPERRQRQRASVMDSVKSRFLAADKAILDKIERGSSSDSRGSHFFVGEIQLRYPNRKKKKKKRKEKEK